VSAPRFATVILDVDSTLCTIEGVDWLAARRGPEVEAEVQLATDLAMQGALALEAVYGSRLMAISPTRDDIEALAVAYRQSLSPGAADVIAVGRNAGIRWILVSGGLRPAILPLALELGIPAADVHAVELSFHEDGSYAGFDAASPLARKGGKPVLVRTLGDLARPMLAVGDGATDAELVAVADAFWCFTGVVERPAVLAAAAHQVVSFPALWSALRASP
jgi:HAD superfamily phosphoserine phosphatase-like hydrolase